MYFIFNCGGFIFNVPLYLYPDGTHLKYWRKEDKIMFVWVEKAFCKNINLLLLICVLWMLEKPHWIQIFAI